MEPSSGEKWWIGGRNSDGQERFYRLQPVYVITSIQMKSVLTVNAGHGSVLTTDYHLTDYLYNMLARCLKPPYMGLTKLDPCSCLPPWCYNQFSRSVINMNTDIYNLPSCMQSWYYERPIWGKYEETFESSLSHELTHGFLL